MPLRNRNQFPIGGYQFFQSQTNWRSDPHVGFDAVVAQIIAHRRANPRFNLTTDRTAVENELEAYTEARMRSIKGGEAYLIEGAPPLDPSFPMPPRQRRIVGAAPSVGGGEVSKVKAGIGTLVEWFGDGLNPAPVDLATKRASICASCTLNKPATGLSVLTGLAAKTVSLLMDAKSDLKLSTPHDDKLETCTACLCDLKLKIWSPIDIVWKHTTPEVFEKLDSACWVRSEPRT